MVRAVLTERQTSDCLFVCLFVWSLSRLVHSYGDVIITCEGLQILTYARHSLPLSSEGSLECHTYCDTGLPFIMVISKDPCHSHLLPSVWHYLFLRLMSVTTGDGTPISRMRCERSTSTPAQRSSDCNVKCRIAFSFQWTFHVYETQVCNWWKTSTMFLLK